MQNSRYPWHLLRRLKCTAAALLMVSPALSAQGSPYVPIADPAYDDLAALTSRGIIVELMVGERPHSEAAFRRFVLEANRRMVGIALSVRETEALARLSARFGGAFVSRSNVRRGSQVATIAVAAAPSRSMLANGVPGNIDADLQLLLQRNEGRVLLNGLTVAYEDGFLAGRGRLAAEFTSRVYAGVPEGLPATGGHDLVAGYGRAVWGPVALDVGRTPYVAGHGPFGGAMYSTNARALDQFRFRADRPVQLPGPFRHLGRWQGTMALANLGSNRDNAGGTLLTMRLSGRPSRLVEWGVTYQNQHSGAGITPSYQYQRLEEIFLPFIPKGWLYENTDRVAGADLRISVPKIRSSVYANFFTTDERYRFRMAAGGYWEDAVWVGGIERTGLGPQGRLDLRLEGRHAGPIPHAHHQFTSGATLDRRTIGDAMGPNSEGLALLGTWTGLRSRLAVEAALDRYRRDVYELFKVSGSRIHFDEDWRIVQDHPDEMRQRLLFSYFLYRGWRGYDTMIRAGYERTNRFDWTERTRHSAVFEASWRRGR